MRAMHSIGFIVSGSAMFLIIGILVFGSREPIHAPHQESNTPVSELRLDLQDLGALMKMSQRPSVLAGLSSQAKRLERQIQRQEILISDGDRLYAAAVRHLGPNPHFTQAKLQLSAAKSAYQRGAALDKVENAALLEETIIKAEEVMASSAAAHGLPSGSSRGPMAHELLAMVLLPGTNTSAAASHQPPATPPTLGGPAKASTGAVVP
eukprot:CAMPEP_0173406054 /NCGR_PEP_ID=MMETSP1356-20130122/63545_1 /TAXON_ID=77927 ORGANISM="Hemiselmis virescens, Strain PCC157" /NCGR_SAMPLE_ID=MMETSP1356 /ASSEMBLY_ACC=CAM_ASM_000847 /LENGTH=207 /DNA_ID=CAMNT_0014366959 /DNA_START=94 /DNA_END=714 /DNA_ORIENTATION=+